MKRFLPSICTFLIIVLAGCQSGLLTEDPEVIAECFYSVDVEVWVDRDADGIRDAGDGPLAGVDVAFYRSGVAPEEYDIQTTSSEGLTELGFIIGGDDCDLTGHQVGIVTLPAGYMAPDIMIGLGGVDSGSTDLSVSFRLIPRPAPGSEPDFELPAGQCFRRAAVEVWQDWDGDGVRDPEDAPMKGVQLGFFEPGATSPSYDIQTTSREGRAELNFVAEGGDDCDLTGHKIGVVTPPIGYLASEVDLGDVGGGASGLQVSLGLSTDPDPGPESRSGILNTECFRGVFAEVWEDSDGDGVRDPNEAPMEGVRVALIRPENEGWVPGELLWTSPQGKAELGFIIRRGGCSLTGYRFGVYEIPAGYLAPQQYVNLGEVDSGETTAKVKIGLVPDPDPGPDLEGQLAAGECFRGIFVESWGDNNRDGIRDEDEWPAEGVRVGLVPPGWESGEELAREEMARTSAQGYAEIGFIVSGEDCALTGYRVLILGVPAGYDFPENPLIDLGAIDTGTETLRLAFGLPPEEE